MPDSYRTYLRRLTQKHTATDEDLSLYRPIGPGQVAVQVAGRCFRLIREDQFDLLDQQEQQEARAAAEINNPFWDDKANAPRGSADLPKTVDHRPAQSPVKDQLDRGTCVAFASLAVLETHILAQTGEVVDLSEQYAHWMFMRHLRQDQCQEGLRATLAARFLTQAGVCTEDLCPYEEMAEVQVHCKAGPSRAAQRAAVYGLAGYTLLDNIGLRGPSIANPDYLEVLLHAGRDIVFATGVAWGRPNADGVLDVILDRYGNPLPSRAGHAMLMVGYDRNAPLPYVILKNSWGLDAGVQGYYYLSYDYVRTYAKYGYFIDGIRLDMPTRVIGTRTRRSQDGRPKDQ